MMKIAGKKEENPKLKFFKQKIVWWLNVGDLFKNKLHYFLSTFAKLNLNIK